MQAWTFWGEAEGASAFDSGDLYYSLVLDLPLEWNEIGYADGSLRLSAMVPAINKSGFGQSEYSLTIGQFRIV